MNGWEKEKGRHVMEERTLEGRQLLRDAAAVVRGERGQGTTEYAILVGVLVVIAIVAILAFRDRIQSLWTSISDGINQL